MITIDLLLLKMSLHAHTRISLIRNDVDVTKRYYSVHNRGLSPVPQAPIVGEETVKPERIRDIFKQLSDKLETDNVPRYALYKQFDSDHDGTLFFRIRKYGRFQRDTESHEN
jgi:hypothetical protein